MDDHKKMSRRTFLKGAAAAGAAGAAMNLLDFEFSGLKKSFAEKKAGRKIVRSACGKNCYDACSILSTVEDGILKKVEGDPTSSYTRGKLCAKGFSYTRRVYSPDRIKYPMKQIGRGSGNWRRVSWDEAYATIAEKILSIKREYGSTLPICLNKYSGNLGIFHYGVEGFFSSIGYTTRALGTPCWPAGIDAQTFDFGTVHANDPEDLANSKFLILWGANPSWCSVHSMHFVQQAREGGCKLIVIDPILTQTASKADLYIQPKSSTDGALALAMARTIIENNLYDEAWLSANSKGYREFMAYVMQNITLEWAEQKTGVPKETIESLAKEYAAAKPANIWIGYGMQRHANGGQNVRAIDALAALTGNIGKSGGGAQYAQLETWGFAYDAMSQKPPADSQGEKDRNLNMNDFAADLLRAQDPPVKMLWLACRSPFTQDAEPGTLKKALESIDLVVTCDMFMTPSVAMSDIVLPVASNFEGPDVNVSYWHYWVSLNNQAIRPLYESKHDVTIAMELSAKLNAIEPGSCTFPVHQNLDEWVGKEFNEKMLNLIGVDDWKELKKGPAKAKSRLIGWQDGNFKTPSGKYEFWSDEAVKDGHPALPIFTEEMQAPKEYPLRCITPHWMLGINGQFQHLDWMMEIDGEPFGEIHPLTAKQYGLKNHDAIRLYNDMGSVKLKARITELAPTDTVVVYNRWLKGRNFNINDTLKAIPADMGKRATGMPGIAFHDNFVAVEKA